MQIAANGETYLSLNDKDVELLVRAAAKAMAEPNRGSYEYKDLGEGWIGIRVFVDPKNVGAPAIKALVVDILGDQFHFERI